VPAFDLHTEFPTIQGLLDEVGAKTGEKVAVRRFIRYRLGEDDGEAGKLAELPVG